MPVKDSAISASRLKTFQSCSWVYWAKYGPWKLPDKTNSGALMGFECHTIFECLLNPRHRKHFDAITRSPASIQNSPVVARHVKKYVKKNKLSNEDATKIDTMVVVGLLYDFFCEKGGGKILDPELAFNITNEDPKYRIVGFMDKPAEYPKNYIRIVDYKSSKQKFEGDDLIVNVQAMMYSLAAKHLYPHLKPIVDFVFLQFPADPVQRLRFTDTQLNGFEYFLAGIYKQINNFSFKDAKSNFAADQPMPAKGDGFKGQLMCGFAKYRGQLKKDGNPMWHCQYKFPFEYFALCNEDGEVVKTSFEQDLIANESKGEFVIPKHYEGCPRWNKKSSKNDSSGFFA